MEIKQLHIFIKVCENKSFSGAAKELYLTQPTVSSHIKSMEHQLGVQLFKRKDKTNELLTDAGKILYNYSKNIFSLVKEAEQAILEYKEGVKGSLSLTSSPTILNWFLVDVVKEYKKQYPQVNLILRSSFTPETIKMVLNREVQYGIIRYQHSKYNHPLLETECIATDKSIFVCSPTHKFSKKSQVLLEDIEKEDFIVYAKETDYWKQINDIFNSFDFQPNISMEVYDIYPIKMMVGKGMGISFVPHISVKQDLNEGNLVSFEVEDLPSIERYSLLIFRKDHIFTGPSDNFYNIISENQFHNCSFRNTKTYRITKIYF